MALSGRRETTSWLSALRVMMLVGVTTSRRDAVFAPAKKPVSDDVHQSMSQLANTAYVARHN
jgi:hypothetical protein